jgi:phosphoglucomutase
MSISNSNSNIPYYACVNSAITTQDQYNQYCDSYGQICYSDIKQCNAACQAATCSSGPDCASQLNAMNIQCEDSSCCQDSIPANNMSQYDYNANLKNGVCVFTSF